MTFFGKQFGNQKVKRLAVLLCSAVALFASTASTAQEQFALDAAPALLFDGGTNLTGSVNGIGYTIVQGYAIAQGDMVLGKLFADGRLEIPIQTRGLGQAQFFGRWPDGIVPYQFSPTSTQIQRDRALEAINHWNIKTSIKLVARDESNSEKYQDYIQFEDSPGCASWVGRRGGEQSIWISDTCTVGSIIHEIGHVVGLFHEHTRPDRDNFVTVNLENIPDDKEINFDIIGNDGASYSEYDYGSIMHYGEFFFSSNGEATISPPDQIEIGQREALSDDDVVSVELMYATDIKLDVSTELTDENARVDLVISNIGALGANSLELTAILSADADWLSISSNSGWDCKQFGAELRCTRATLIERTDSSFTILVDPKSASIDDLYVNVVSNTFDTDLANNSFNEPPPIEEAEPEPEQETQQTIIQDSGTSENGNPQSGEPAVAPANGSEENPSESESETENEPDSIPSTDTDNGSKTESNNGSETTRPALGEAKAIESSGGGGAGLYLLMLLAALRYKTALVRRA